MDALAAESIKTISSLNPHDLSGTAWAFATLSYQDHVPLLQAISAASIPLLSEFNSQDLANTAWSFATRCFKNPEMMDSQSAEVLSKISEFAPQGLATTAWAYSSLGITDATLLEAISAEVRRKLSEIEAQSLGILADAKLACREEVERTLQPLAERLVQHLPSTLDASAAAAFAQFVRDLRVDNFGAWGTRYVFRRMNFPEPPPDFHERAARRIFQSASAYGEERRGREVANALSGTALVHRRVFSYAEYDIRIGGSRQPLVGSLTRENGRRDRPPGAQDEGARRDRAIPCPQPLRSLASPISGLVDRSLCSEFQLLNAIMDLMWQDSGTTTAESSQGLVRLFVSTAPCISCIWALRQFQLLVPWARIEVANGEESYLFST
mmetsp:Transcript_146364/g.407739  ORF Transcript_146364/g.407739 Transcript_146364/m.407739 type:complete len:382 (-) Transcript_146364:139-1284(-)